MSIVAVARQAGVSTATVSRVLNRPALVAPATREAVQAAARALGYAPNESARSLRSQRSRSIGVLLPSLGNPVFAECLSGIAAAAADAGYSILPLTTDYRAEREREALARFVARGVDALILTVANAASSSTLTALRRLRLPYVLAYNRHPRHACVSVDGETAVAQLVARLREQGHVRIAMASGPLAASDRAAQRLRGYEAAMRAAELEPERIELPFVEPALEPVLACLRRDPRPSALICSNDLLALRCLRAAALAGLRVPADLSVVGFDGIALGRETMPTLASIAQPNEQIGRSCVACLLGHLDAGTRPDGAASITLPCTLNEFESMGPAARCLNPPRRTA